MDDPSDTKAPPLVVDMHAHYPMRWMPRFYWNGFALLRVALFGGSAKAAKIKLEVLEQKEGVPSIEVLEAAQKWHVLSNRVKAILIALANIFLNFESPFAGYAISPDRMRMGGVRLAFSVLIDPCDEILDDSDKNWPAGTPFQHLTGQIKSVKETVNAKQQQDQVWIPERHELTAAIKEAREGGRIALIHCVEGGYHLGDNKTDVTDNIATLAKHGVAYVTLAHLLYRRLATCANALPIPDWAYHRWFPQDDIGLTELGKHAVRQLAKHRILIDVCHMSKLAIIDTLCVLDEFDRQNRNTSPTPVIATHMACRIDSAEYNLSDDTIKRVIARKGLLGVIVSRHWMRQHSRARKYSWADTCQIVSDHLERISTNGDCKLKCAAIGSDHDGFIKHALYGLEHPGKMKCLSSWIASEYPGEAADILHENAIRVLQDYWSQPTA